MCINHGHQTRVLLTIETKNPIKIEGFGGAADLS
jgi:hypothetical protein